MTANLVISRMTAAELTQLMSWVVAEGWNPGLHDAATFYQADPHAFFVGKIADEPVVIASAAIYQSAFAFFGLLIAKPEFREQGYGLAITKARLDYINDLPAGLDGVVNMQQAYKRNNFILTHRNLRYKAMGQVLNKPLPNIVPVAQLPLNALIAYDTKHFPAERSNFLQAWVKQPDCQAFAYVSDQEIKGYGLIRPCQFGYKIGPWFADDEKIADALLQSLLNVAKDKPAYIDIPEPNSQSLQLTKQYKMEFVFETGRMYRGKPPALPLQTIFGITTLELG